ncbi:hypothetical protein FRC01_011854, partial [Tulasnella sp. 417]
MQLSPYRSLFRLWFLASLRTILASVERLLRAAVLAAATSDPSPPLRYKPKTGPPISLEKPSNHERYVDLLSSTFQSKNLINIRPVYDYKEIPGLVDQPATALGHWSARRFGGVKDLT